jgi:hypothetical protein
MDRVREKRSLGERAKLNRAPESGQLVYLSESW